MKGSGVGGRPRMWLAPVMFLFSGACALIAEVLWSRALRVTLGGSYRVDALVLGVFFGAVPIGAVGFGSRWVRSADMAQLWRRYAAVEGAMALSVFLPIALSRGLLMKSSPAVETGVAYLVLACLSIPGAAVGAAWPLMAGIVRAQGGRIGTLYGLNTLGAAGGALAASFVLMEKLGTSGGLLLCAGIGGALALTAAAISIRPLVPVHTSARAPIPLSGRPGQDRLLWAVAALAGFVSLGFEILGARLLAVRITTTTYSLGLVLAVQLLGMAAGAFVVPILLRSRRQIIPYALALAATGIVWAPFVASFRGLPTAASHSDQVLVARAVWETLILLGPGALTTGALFPLASAFLSDAYPGDYARLGRLSALNGIFALCASLVIGFMLIPLIGLSRSFALLAFLAGVLASVAAFGQRRRGLSIALFAFAMVVALAASRLSVTHVQPGEEVLAVIEGPASTAAVVETGQGVRRLVVDGRFIMGDSLSRSVARRLALLPAVLQPSAKSVLILGMGTGMTKGAAQEVCSVVGCSVDVVELMPEVADLSYLFAPWQARFGASVRMHIADGRRILRTAPTPFDLVIFDVLHPWHPGTAFLYTAEAFRTVKARLSQDGRAVVWLPLYQLSMESVVTILETFRSVFPAARMLAAGLDPARQVLAMTSGVLPGADGLDRAIERLRGGGAMDDPLLMAGGALSALDLGNVADIVRELKAEGLAPHAAIQTDDRPWVEFDGARVQGTGNTIRAEGFRRLLAASDRVRGVDRAETGFDHCLRAMWLKYPQSLPHLVKAIADRRSHALAVQMASMLSRRAALDGESQYSAEYAALAEGGEPPSGVLRRREDAVLDQVHR